MCADVCLHDTGGGNPHAHIMLTMRPFDEDGEWGAKQKKEYILDGDGNKIYDPKKRQYKCNSIPTKAWKDEYTKLTAERKTLNQRYLALKEEVKEAEKIRKSVYSILRQEQHPHRKQDMER